MNLSSRYLTLKKEEEEEEEKREKGSQFHGDLLRSELAAILIITVYVPICLPFSQSAKK